LEETENRPDYDSDEINLYALFQVIWKRKLLIIGIFLIAVIAAAIISYTSPPIYRVVAFVAPGWIYTEGGKATNIDSAENIKSLIENKAFCPKIKESLKLDPLVYANLKFSLNLVKGTDALSISYDTNDPEKGKIILGELLKQLTDYYKNRTETARAASENKLARIINDKKMIMSDIKLSREKAALLKITEKKLINQFTEIEENTRVIMRERTEMLKKGEKTDSVALLLYSNTIQQNLSYIDSLNASLEKNRFEQESAKNALSKAEIDLKNKDSETIAIDAEIKKIEGLKIIQEPYIFPNPVGPRKTRNMAVAGVTSLFFGIFLVFLLEFIRKAKASSAG
jgi:capsular polysaccharide biosynthesis protein